MTDELVERLDRILAILELAYKDEIAAAVSALRADKVTRLLIDASLDWVPVGTLKARVAAAAETSEKTVQRRVAELVESGHLLEQGVGAARQLKYSGAF